MSGSKPSSIWNNLARVTAAASAAILAACATPNTKPPEPTAGNVDAAAQRQRAILANTSKIAEGPVSPYINFPVEQRVGNVVTRITIAAAPYCTNNLTTAYPIAVGTPDNGQPVVMDTESNLRPGDRVIGVNGRQVSPGQQGRNNFLDARDAAANSKSPLSVDVMRGNLRMSAKLNPVTACKVNAGFIPANVYPSDKFNAFSDGKTLYMTPLVPQLVKNDSDMAYVLGHELTHHALGHTADKKTNAIIGGALGLVVDIAAMATGVTQKAAAAGMDIRGVGTQAGVMTGATSYSVNFEKEADYGASYILARAGYDLDAAQRTSQLLAVVGKDPKLVTYAGSHPSSASREAAGIDTKAEIKDKIARGQPLLPNTKRGASLN